MSISRRRLVAAGFLVTAVTSLGLASATPAGAVPSGPAAANPVPANRVPADAVPADAVPANAVPANAVPANAVPADQAATPPSTPPSMSPAMAATGKARADATARYAPKAAPPAAGKTSRVGPLALTYLYGVSYQYATADGLYSFMTVARPALATADFHSLGELAAQSADGLQIVEIGWTVDRGLYGDDNARLFVFHWIDGNPTCYNGCGFVQSTASTVRPGDILPLGTAFFGIQHYQGNWWVGYGSQWVGYFPDARWGGRYTQTGLNQWFGEVAANSASPCTDMGNGLAAANTGAAAINSMTFYNGPTVNKTTYATHPTLYSAVSTGSASMRFGGPGAC
ncbi:neprosin family prolyl endopeptidase [Actinomycetes bacterium KLBMP 9797]